ncbi:MAG: general secretion pathway protein A [Flavobacteriales bacterium]|jgi:general secretion pathway protein A
MYHKYFGLEEAAFSIAVNPKFLYMSEQHREALAHLLYGIKGGGFVLLSGEVGSGKTTIIRTLLQQVPENTEIAFVLNPMADVRDLMQTICEELRLPFYEDNPPLKQLNDSLAELLLSNYSAGKRTVLLIDEAQLLSIEVLEQIRLLTNLETSDEKLLQIVLVAQPEIHDLLAQPRLRQLSQRITARFFLEPLSCDDCERYINHRLVIAGKEDNSVIFPRAIVKRIHHFSRGTPRLINIVCERSLIGAYAHNKRSVDAAIFSQALREITGQRSVSQSVFTELPQKAIIAGAAFALIVIVGIVSIAITLLGSAPPAIQAQQSEQAPIAVASPIEVSTVEASTVTTVTLDEPKVLPTTLPTSPENASSAYFKGLSLAYAKLFEYHDIPYDSFNHPCWQSKTHFYQCEDESFDTWQEFESLNRPAILELIDSEQTRYYALVIGQRSDVILLIDDAGQMIERDANTIVDQWDGKVRFIWKNPKGYKKPLGLRSRSSLVEWVADSFATIDGQDQSLSGQSFNEALKRRVIQFQLSKDLEADGVIGRQTLMAINDDLKLSIPFLKTEKGE